VRADQGDPRRERRRLRRHHARHHVGAPRRGLHLRALEGADRRAGPGVGAVQLRQPVRAAVPFGRSRRSARDGVARARAGLA
jgi:hypothetical protein